MSLIFLIYTGAGDMSSITLVPANKCILHFSARSNTFMIVQSGSKTPVNNTSRTRYYSLFQRIKDPLVLRKELASPRNVSANRTYSKSTSARGWDDRNLRNQARPRRRTLHARRGGVKDPEEQSPPPPWQSEPCGAKSRCEVQKTPCGKKGVSYGR